MSCFGHLRQVIDFVGFHPGIALLIDDTADDVAENDGNAGHHTENHQHVVIRVFGRFIGQGADTGIGEYRFHDIDAAQDMEEILMLLDLGYASENAKPLVNHFSRKELTETVQWR